MSEVVYDLLLVIKRSINAIGNRAIGSPPAVVELDGSTKHITPTACRGNYVQHAITIATVAACRMMRIVHDSTGLFGVVDAVFRT